MLWAIAFVTLGVGVLWPGRLRKVLPPTLAALIAGTLLGVLWLTDTPVIGGSANRSAGIDLPDVSLGVLAGAVAPAVTIALLGSIDSLLTSLIADTMTRTRHKPNRELVGQGIGKHDGGVRRGTAGSRGDDGHGGEHPGRGDARRCRGWYGAGILLALVLGLGGYAEKIPHAVLAGILMKVGWDIIDWRFITRIHPGAEGTPFSDANNLGGLRCSWTWSPPWR